MSARTTRRRGAPTRRHLTLGLAAIFAVAVIGLVAYDANTGLPLQQRAHYFLDVPNAERLIDSADVRIGGVRVGEVLDVKGIAEPGRRPYAQIGVALDGSVKRLPVDSTAQVRPASVLGLTYVDLRLGHSARSVPTRGTLPLTQATPTSDLTDLFAVFDKSSAHRFRQALTDVSGGITGRGTALNATIRSLSTTMPALTSVADVLAASATRLPDFVSAYKVTVDALAPVGRQLAHAVTGGATTFAALAEQRRALAATIAEAPATESAVTDAFTAARPGLADLARLVSRLRPGARALRPTLTRMNRALTAGVRPLREMPGLARTLDAALVHVDKLSRDPNTNGALRKLTDLASASHEALSLLVPAQVHCNVISLFTQTFAGAYGTLGSGDGPALAGLFMSTGGAQGEGFQNAKPSANAGINPLPHENAQECESGNEPWTGKQMLGNPPGLQSNPARPTAPPPGVRDRAAAAGLMTDPEGAPR
jgi:virulence factor Mce-like protein